MNNKKKKNNKIKGIWFYGLSKSGKTTSSRFFYEQKKNKNIVVIDGDVVRKLISFDLGYSVKNRLIQLRRLFGIAKICINSDTFPVVSSVYMTSNLSKQLKKNKILLINIQRNFNILKKEKFYQKRKNIVGIDIKYQKFETIIIYNNKSKINLKKNIKSIISTYD
jgi:adenylylsulfate kinase-like enzyme